MKSGVRSFASRGVSPGNSQYRFMSTLKDEILRRHTFAALSQPDTGTTILTENLLLSAGRSSLRAKSRSPGELRSVRSHWLAVERERNLSLLGSDELRA